MICVDLHTHTIASHGQDSVLAMYRAALKAGISVFGFSEHSPRPLGYDYPCEYREHLVAHFPSYIKDVRALQAEHDPSMQILLGVELDWFDDELPFMERVLAELPYDYVIGGLHFLGKWGFDADASDWDSFDDAEYADLCVAYYASMQRMAQSGLVNIVAHPDLIKIFTVQRFDAWIARAGSLDVVAKALQAMADHGVSMEVSSAGLRKPCASIYPCPAIMRLAKDIGVSIAFGSDSHCAPHVAYGFDALAKHAHVANFTEAVYYMARKPHVWAF